MRVGIWRKEGLALSVAAITGALLMTIYDPQTANSQTARSKSTEANSAEAKSTESQPGDSKSAVAKSGERKPLPKTDAEWKKQLTPEQFSILRKKKTEKPFTGKYWDAKTVGTYCCAGCGESLFESATKFDSKTGWPSFWQPAGADKVALKADNSLFVSRTEVLCHYCKGHLGHVFNDGPPPTGLRFCINSAALDFKPQAKPSSGGE